MAKTVFKGRGALISGVCPSCVEPVSVFLQEDEAYKNSRCVYCGAELYGDGISGIIREGHHVSLISSQDGSSVSVGGSVPCRHDLLEYDRKRQEELQEKSRQHFLFEIPHKIMKLAGRD